MLHSTNLYIAVVFFHPSFPQSFGRESIVYAGA